MVTNDKPRKTPKSLERQPSPKDFWDAAREADGPDAGMKAAMALPRIVPVSPQSKALSVSEQLDQLWVEWLCEFIPPRLYAAVRAHLSKKKIQPARGRGRPPLTFAELMQLRDEYDALIDGGMNRGAVLEFLQAMKRRSRKTIENHYSRARSLKKTSK